MTFERWYEYNKGKILPLLPLRDASDQRAQMEFAWLASEQSAIAECIKKVQAFVLPCAHTACTCGRNNDEDKRDIIAALREAPHATP